MLQISDLDCKPAGRPGVCRLCGQPYTFGESIVSLGSVDGDHALAHVQPCMADSLAAGAGSFGWDQAFKSMVPTRFDPTAWVKDSRLRFMAPYDPEGFAALKKIVGRSYHADPKPHWSFPIERKDEVLAIAASWPNLKVSSELRELKVARSSRRIDVAGGLVRLHFPWNEAASDAVKALPGASWDRGTRAWTFPLEQLDAVLEVSRRVLPGLQLTPAFVRQQRLEEQALHSASAHGTDRVIEYPGVGRLHGYQTEGVRFLQARGGRGIMADEMGLGKTIQVLSYARERGVGQDGLRALWIVPASLRLNWARETRKWMQIAPEQIFVCGIKPHRRMRVPFRLAKTVQPIPDDVAVVIINYDIIGRWVRKLVDARFGLVAFDEAQYLKNSRSLRSREGRYVTHGVKTLRDVEAWLPGWEFQVVPGQIASDPTEIRLRKLDKKSKKDKVGVVLDATRTVLGNMYSDPADVATLLVEARSRHPRLPDLDLSYPGIPERIPATGTPIMSRPPDLWHLLHLVDPAAWSGESGGYRAFTKRYMGAYVNHRGHWTLGKRATNTEELNRRIIGNFVCRRLKADVLTELPPKTINRVLLEPTMTELRAYHDLSDQITALREDYERQKVRAQAATDPESREEILVEARRLLGEALGRATQLRQTLGVCKVPAVMRWLQQLMDAGEPLVVFAWHKAVQAALIEALRSAKIETSHVLGDDKPLERQDAIDRFQGGRVAAIICSIQAAGAGITLHRSAHTIHVERAWNPGVNAQAEDRTHRIGQERPCFGWYLDVPGTLDDALEQTCHEKARDQQLILDGRVIPQDGSTFMQRSVLAHAIGLTQDDLRFLDER